MGRKSISVTFTGQRNESSDIGLWVGTVVGEPSQVFDRVKGTIVSTSHAFRCDVYPEGNGEWFCLMTRWYMRPEQGYVFYKTLEQAMEAGSGWAKRRFAYL